ncbi:MAG: hypothetical protein HY614_03665, partial [Candidatus Rokubacteria bacterium]|nr:hypothetical protein [Candidatus Rokubacteria bacterium]
PERFGVLLGVNVLAWDLAAMTRYLVESESVDHPGVLDMSRANRYCMHQINPLDFSLKTLPNLAAGHAAIAYNAQAICRALTEGPVGGVHAVGQAYRFVAEGDLNVALCGGADAPVEEMVFATYAGSRFFGWEAEGEPGPIGGEGAGLLVLEAAEHARARGAVVRAEVLGFSATAGDGTPVPDADPDRLAERIAATVNAVVEEAGTRPDVVSLHGDGGVVHDAAEARALAAVLGDAATRTARVAMKPQHGDLGAGSGPVELAACSMLLERAIIPPVAWQPPKQPSAPPRSALLIALGFFGECAALMLGRTSPEGERAA